jgi:hemolysin III
MTWLDCREPVNAWTHGIWMLCALPACVVLVRICRGDRLKQISLLVFGLSLAFCMAASSLYHGIRLPPTDLQGLRTLDYVGVFLLIAGTVTPAALIVLKGGWRWTTLALAWGLAILGIVLHLVWAKTPEVLSTSLYIGMGWTVCLCYFELARALSHRAMRPVWIGGLLYTGGAVLDLTRWPVLAPGLFGTHELFHVCVMAGSLCHFWFMVRYVAPFKRARHKKTRLVPVGLQLAPALLSAQPTAFSESRE